MRIINLFPQDSQRVLKASFLRGLNQALGLIREFLIILLLEKELIIIYFSVKSLIEIPAIVLSQNAVFSIPKKDDYNSYINSFINYPDLILILFAILYILVIYFLGFVETHDISFMLFSIGSIFAAILNISFSKLVGQYGIIRGSLYPFYLSGLTCVFFLAQYGLDITGLNALLISRIIVQIFILLLLIFRFKSIFNFSQLYFPNIIDMVQVNLFIVFIAIARFAIRYMTLEVGVVFNYLLFFVSPILLLLVNTSFQNNMVRNEKIRVSNKKKVAVIVLIYIMSFISVLITKVNLNDALSLILYVSILLLGILYGIKSIEKWSMLRY